MSSQPKAQPKSAVNNKHNGAAKKGSVGKTRGGAKGRGGAGGGARNSRPSKKTTEELDSEMADYFTGAPGETSNGAAPATNGGDAPMDEIMVSSVSLVPRPLTHFFVVNGSEITLESRVVQIAVMDRV